MQPLQQWQINNTRTSACLLPSPTSRFEWFPLANYAFTHLKTTVIVELDASNLSFGAMLYQQSETDSHNCHCARTFYPPSLVILMEQGIIGQFFFLATVRIGQNTVLLKMNKKLSFKLRSENAAHNDREAENRIQEL